MRKFFYFLTSVLTFVFVTNLSRAAAMPCSSGTHEFVLTAHGGGGNWSVVPEERRKIQKEHLSKVMDIIATELGKGMSAVDAVELLISLLEDSGYHNAGKGGKKNIAGIVELDASIMDGSTMKSGATAATKNVKNPIKAARKVMENSNHIFFVGSGAEEFAKIKGLTPVPQSYFSNYFETNLKKSSLDKKYGTVGAAILDKCGNLAAGTSTGGWSTKTPGRVGDSPVVGAGTYATKDLAISATGHGEMIVRYAAAHEIYSQYRYLYNANLDHAASNVVEQLEKSGAKAGFTTVDKNGVISQPFNTEGMLRGFIQENGQKFLKIFP